MKSEILYLELKSGFSDNGPAWIGKVEFSKSGRTLYFNNSALKKLKKPGIYANHFDIETGEEYWVSGVKKNGQDRHWAGGGKVMIEHDSIEDYLKLVDFGTVDEKFFDIVDIPRTDKSRFNDIENSPINWEETNNTIQSWYWDNNRKKFSRND